MLQTSSKIGLKEWSVTSEALGSGEQIFMLRKGGTREDGRHFKIEHEKFLLYPGLFHEGELLLKDEYQHMLRTTPGADFTTEVPISVYCELAETIDISEEEQVRALDEHHIWSKEFPVKRFSWKPRHPLKLMIVRAYRLTEPVTIPVEDSYAGCKSWVDLADRIDLKNATPALTDSEFAERVAKIQASLTTETVNA